MTPFLSRSHVEGSVPWAARHAVTPTGIALVVTVVAHAAVVAHAVGMI